MHNEDDFVYLNELAKRSMYEYDLLPEFSFEALQEVDKINFPAKSHSTLAKDLRHVLWFSLDNDDSKDLDQVTYAKAIEGGNYKIYIAVADVSTLIKKQSAIDLYAQHNTTSVYTPTQIFPMLPKKLSTNLTSLNENQERLAVVVEVDVERNGACVGYSVYPAYIKNHAKLTYNSVSAWLDGAGPTPELIKKIDNLDVQVRLQDKIAQQLRQHRAEQGALNFQTLEAKAIVREKKIVDMVTVIKNRGRDLIEDFMIAANQSIALFLSKHDLPSLRRVVRTPKRWDRIVEVARQFGYVLPELPDATALNKFLMQRQQQDPLHFPDLSLTIIKLLGSGEYIVEYPGEKKMGHFGLALKDYTHATAPNRRFPDLITQRFIQFIFEKDEIPYTPNELEFLAKHCTEKEDDADKVERKMKKSAACLLLSSQLNQQFDGIVTGASPKGTWVRIAKPPIEGKLVRGFEHVDVGDTIRVQLVRLDAEKGFIDFVA